MNKFTKRICADLKDEISAYVSNKLNEVNYTEALVLPNYIVLLVGNGSIRMWDNCRQYSICDIHNAEVATDIIFSTLCLWYCDDLATKVFRKKTFTCPSGKYYNPNKFNFPMDEEGYPAMSEDEMLIKFRDATKEDNVWTSEEMKEILGIDWDVRTR